MLEQNLANSCFCCSFCGSGGGSSFKKDKACCCQRKLNVSRAINKSWQLCEALLLPSFSFVLSKALLKVLLMLIGNTPVDLLPPASFEASQAPLAPLFLCSAAKLVHGERL
jgi:hypothetical protein